MMNPLKKYLAAALAFVAALVPAVFAQETKNPPWFDIEKVDFSSAMVPASSLKWGQTEVKFRLRPTQDYLQDVYLKNVKMTLTLVYPMTPETLLDKRVRGTKEERDAELAAGKEETGTRALYAYYRASVIFPALKVGDTSRYVRFFIPGEIVDRESRSKDASAQRFWSGNIAPVAYWVQFNYAGEDVPLYKADGKLLSSFSIGGQGDGKIKPRNLPKSVFEKMASEADGVVGDTKGLLMPHVYLPYMLWPKKDAPAILREEIQQ